MSRFFVSSKNSVAPYVAGEQPQGRSFVKLNTNENPYPPSLGVRQVIEQAASRLQLYSDPAQRALRSELAAHFGGAPENYVGGNGSDEILSFIFQAFCDSSSSLAYPSICYSFYEALSGLYGLSPVHVPLRSDFSVDVDAFCALGPSQLLVITNPNAPTGLALPLSELRRIVEAHPEAVCVIDEAYVDFGGESAVPLCFEYDNVIVVQTYSKAWSLAGLRLGFACAPAPLIEDLERIRNSINPYNISSLGQAAGVAALKDASYYQANVERVCDTRELTTKRLQERGFEVLPSKTNFIFAKHPLVGGKELYLSLKEKGVLIRHFDTDYLRDYNRISIGSPEQMDAFMAAVDEVLDLVRDESCGKEHKEG